MLLGDEVVCERGIDAVGNSIDELSSYVPKSVASDKVQETASITWPTFELALYLS